jgi:hypothetical protein
MDCDEIQERLSEYIDGALDEKTARTIEKHISTCEDCKETYASLSAVVKELNALEPMTAPTDFLEKIHERMEARPKDNRLFKKLFVPFKVKVPLQLAAAAAVSILVILVFNFQKSKFQVIQPYKAYQSERAAEKPKADRIRPLYKEKTKYPAPVFEETPSRMSDSKHGESAQRSIIKPLGRPSIQKKSGFDSAMSAKAGPSAGTGRPIELALVLNTGVMGAASQGHLAIKAAPMRKSIDKSAEKESIDKDRSGKSSEVRQKIQGENFLSGMNRILEPLRGNVLSMDYAEHVGRLESILVQIPSTNYAYFCKDLSRLASFKTPPPALSDKSLKTVNLLINLTYPE